MLIRERDIILANVKKPIGLETLANVAGAFLLYFAIYLRDSVSQFFPSSIFLLALGCGTLLLAARTNTKVSRDELIAMFVFSFLLIINSKFQAGIQLSNYLVAPIVAFFAAKKAPWIFLRLLVFHMFLSLAVQGYEYLSGNYLFVTIAEDGSALTTEFFAGAAGVFRAKGMFQGPLSAVGFYLLMIILIPRLSMPFFALVGSLMAYGRLGIMLSTALLINHIYSSSRAIVRILMIVGIPLIIALASPVLLQGSFFLAAFDPSSSNNLARLYFWSKSIDLYLSYSFWSLLFGDLGYVNAVFKVTESDFLRLLLDCGIVTFTIYIFVLRRFYIIVCRDRKMGLVVFLAMVLAMNVFPFIQSLNAAVTFWFIFWLGNRSTGYTSATLRTVS